MRTDKDPRTIPTLVTDLVQQLTTLVRTEGRLLREELNESVHKVGSGAMVVAAGAMIYIWLMAILPADGKTRWVLMVSALVAVIALLMLRRKLIYWHSEMEIEILSVIETGETKMTTSTAPWLQPHGEWNLHMIDCTPERARFSIIACSAKAGGTSFARLRRLTI